MNTKQDQEIALQRCESAKEKSILCLTPRSCSLIFGLVCLLAAPIALRYLRINVIDSRLYLSAAPESESHQTIDLPEPGREKRQVDVGELPIEVDYPLDISSQAVDLKIELDLLTNRLHFTRVAIWVDDCLKELRINGEILSDKQLPWCDWNRPAVLNFGKHLRPGVNRIEAIYSNRGGSGRFRIESAAKDPWFLYIHSLVLLALLGIAGSILRAPGRSRSFTVAGLIITLGIWLRYVYMMSTPFNVRAYDFYGHAEYVVWLAQQYLLPGLHDGWETFQPPLYYLLGAVIFNTAKSLGWDSVGALNVVQFFSFFLSCVTLAAGAWIGFNIRWPKRPQLALHLYLLGLAVLPGLIYPAAWISNDTLITSLNMLALALYTRWWLSPGRARFISATMVVGLAILTKSTALAWIPVIVLLVLLHPLLNRRERIYSAASGGALLYLVSGWYAFMRWGQEAQSNIIGDRALNGALLVPNHWLNYLVFNPIEMLRNPFNNPWSDAARRQYLWEYLFRSAFFGEFNMGEARTALAVGMLALAILLGMFFLWGLAVTSRAVVKLHFPMLLVLAVFLAGLITVGVKHRYSVTQEFRFVHVLAVPVIFLTVLGIVQTRIGRAVGALLMLFIALASIALTHSFVFSY